MSEWPRNNEVSNEARRLQRAMSSFVLGGEPVYGPDIWDHLIAHDGALLVDEDKQVGSEKYSILDVNDNKLQVGIVVYGEIAGMDVPHGEAGSNRNVQNAPMTGLVMMQTPGIHSELEMVLYTYADGSAKYHLAMAEEFSSEIIELISPPVEQLVEDRSEWSVYGRDKYEGQLTPQTMGKIADFLLDYS